MKTKRRREIRLETHELTIIRFPSRQPEIFCPACAGSVLHLEIGQAPSAWSLPEMAIFRLAESGQLCMQQFQK